VDLRSTQQEARFESGARHLGQEEEVKTPCIKVCQMDPVRGVCIGCCRTLDEIARWGAMSDFERERVLSSLPERKARLANDLSTPEASAR
jgi:hypothetical protein